MDPWGARQVFTGLMVLVGSNLVVLLMVVVGRELAEGGVEARSALGMAGALLFGGLWLTMAVRFHLAGIYVNDRGVRLRHVFSTRTLRWSEVTGFEVRPALLLGGPTVRDACWVRTADGAFEAPVQRKSRKAGWRKDNGPVLATTDFEGMLARLDAVCPDATIHAFEPVPSERATCQHAAAQLDGGGVVSR
ncbi:PH domain-containing protein [Micromonospora sp. CA-111912]|uniref:PH domain-containing protein n=1 Tax=Micromonospora sp. CA-111912 TaxID=3239955 RepID=UPI003D8C44F0